MKTAFITGAAQGLGKALADVFTGKSWRVIATDVHAPDPESFHHPGNIIPFRLDVRKPEDAEKISVLIKQRDMIPEVLINNAGIFDLYPLTESDPERLQHIFHVNAFGALNVIRAFLPLLSGSGARVIQISSESANIPWAFQPYQISKITLEALSRAIRQELRMKGIRLTMIRAGAIRTRLSDQALAGNPLRPDSLFHSEYKAFASRAGRYFGRIMPPETVAKKIFRIAQKKEPRFYYNINRQASLRLLSTLPEKWQDRLVLRILRDNKHTH